MVAKPSAAGKVQPIFLLPQGAKESRRSDGWAIKTRGHPNALDLDLSVEDARRAMTGSASFTRLALAIHACLALCMGAGRALAAPACPSVGFVVAERSESADTRPIGSGRGDAVFVRRQAITTTPDITEIKLAGDDDDTHILLKFTPQAAARLHEATTNSSGLRLAFVYDDFLVSLVTWTGPYGMDADLGVQLSIKHGMAQAAPLVKAVQDCLSGSPP